MGLFDFLGFGNKSNSIQEFKDKGAVIIDVRSQGEFAGGHIKGAKNIPLNEIRNKIDDIKTATLWKKQKSTFNPDYCAVKLENNPWIVQPFENYEEVRIEDLVKKHKSKG